MYRRRSGLQNVLILLFDMATITVSLYLATLLREGSVVDSSYLSTRFLLNLSPMLLFFLASNLLFNNNKDFYIRGYLLELAHVVWNNIIMLSGTSVALFFLRNYDIFSRLAIFYFFIIDSFLMWAVHIMLKKAIPKLYMQLLQERSILLVGSRGFIESYLSDHEHTRNFSDLIVGAVLYGDELKEGETLSIGAHSIRIVASVEGLSEYCKNASLDEIAVGAEGRSAELIPVLDRLSRSGIAISYQIDIPELSGCRHRVYSGTEHIDMIVYANKVVSVGYLLIKRFMDIIGGIVGCVILIPLFLIFAPLIKHESEGPVFFSQKRVGRNGRIFKLYKFRSMYKDAEARKAELMGDNEMQGIIFKMEDDPRVTKIGRFLRKTSLDEFPQFINVLKGDMSLVGTRPPTLDEFSKYSLNHKKRLSFRPGLTGLWQVSGRNDITDFEEIVALDFDYIDNWSILLDIKILFKTIPAMFKGK